MTRFDHDVEFLLTPTCEAPCVRAALVKRSMCGIVRRELSSADQPPSIESPIERPQRPGHTAELLCYSASPLHAGLLFFAGHSARHRAALRIVNALFAAMHGLNPLQLYLRPRSLALG